MLTTKIVKKKYDDGEGVEITFYDNGVEIGECSTCSYDGKPNIFLHGLEVKKKFRGKGYGSQIMKYMIKEYGSKILYVSKNNKVAVSLYEKFGFKVTDTFDKNMLVMERGSSKMKTLKESSIFDSIKLI